MSGIFFTSDTHFGHKKAIEFENRRFDSVEEMDEALIANWNETVGPQDTVYHLGDLSFMGATETAELLDRLNGHIHWILGNHDKSLKGRGRVWKRFSTINDMLEIKVEDADAVHGKQRIVMCHFPMLTWNCAHYGSWMLHGHCHGTLRHPHVMRLMDVGVDPNLLAPISYENVKRYMASKVFVPVDCHKEKA